MLSVNFELPYEARTEGAVGVAKLEAQVSIREFRSDSVD